MLTLLARLVLTVLPGAPAASAEEPLASEPRPRQVLTAPPGWVTLAFGHELDPSAVKLLVLDSDGDSVTINDLIVEGTNMTMQLRDGLPRDTYTVQYRLNGADGRVAGGAFQFAYGSPQWTAVADASWSGSADEPAIFRDTDPQGNPIEASPTATVPDVVVVQSGGPTITVTPSPEATPTVPQPSGATPSGSAAPATPGASGGMGLPTAAILGGLAVAALGTAAAVVIARRRRRP